MYKVRYRFSFFEAYLIFVTGTTGGACVKKNLSSVKFSVLNAKTTYLALFGGNFFVFFGCFRNFWCKMLGFKIPAGVKEMTNMRYVLK